MKKTKTNAILYIIVGFILISGALINLTIPFAHAEDQAVLPSTGDSINAPTTPLLLQSTIAKNIVVINWQRSEQGTYPIKDYIILKKTTQDYLEIGRVDNTQTTFVDTDGSIDSRYVVQSEDDQTPPNISPRSDEIIPVPDNPTIPFSLTGVTSTDSAQAGSIQSDTINTPTGTTPEIENSSDSLTINSTAESHIENNDTTLIKQLDTPETLKSEDKAKDILNNFTADKVLLLDHINSFPSDIKSKISSNCIAESQSIETSLLLLPDSSQIDGLEALANCQLLMQTP
ncbi:MAG: hypothetical protein NVSMB46_08960 [Candidatus Saccharimonadales bacterium]